MMKEKEKLFSEREVAELTRSYPDRIIRFLKEKRYEEALGACEFMRESRIILHDYYAETCTMLWSWTGENLGEETLEDMFKYIFKQSAERQLYSVAHLFRIFPKVAISILAKTGWRSHCCFGFGDYPANFRLTEDDRKFTFHLDPCASGMRMWVKGIYNETRGGKVTEKPHTWAFCRKGMPYYCIHSAFLNEIMPYESLGYILWPTDEPKEMGDVCKWHIYKDPNDIPEKYYKRYGFKKNDIQKASIKREKNRYFTENELKEIARPMTDRISEEIKSGNFKNAIKLCNEVRDEFLFLHDLYMNMIVSTLTFIGNRAGETGVGKALQFQYEKCVKLVVDNLGVLTQKDSLKYLIQYVVAVDNCNGTGIPRPRHSIRETGDKIFLKLDPCGSGGRLIKGGAYKPLGIMKRLREDIVNRLFIFLSKYLPLPDSFLIRFFYKTGGYVTQRKPYSQGKTKQAHSWSFNKNEIPYFCCLCGTINKNFPESCFSIHPPEKNNSPCVWVLEKE